jgi:hypothetical protein
VAYFDSGEHAQLPSRAAEISNRLHLLKEPLQERKQQNNFEMPNGKKIAPDENILMLFPLQPVPELVSGKSR